MFDCIINIQMNYKCSQVSPASLLGLSAPPRTEAERSSTSSDHSAPTCRTVIHSINEFPRLAYDCVPPPPTPPPLHPSTRYRHAYHTVIIISKLHIAFELLQPNRICPRVVNTVSGIDPVPSNPPAQPRLLSSELWFALPALPASPRQTSSSPAAFVWLQCLS